MYFSKCICKCICRICCVTYRSIRSQHCDVIQCKEKQHHAIQCNMSTSKFNSEYNAFGHNMKHSFVTKLHLQCRVEPLSEHVHCSMFCRKLVVVQFYNFIMNTVSQGGFATPNYTFIFLLLFCSESPPAFSGSSSLNTHARVSHLKCVICNSGEGILTMIKPSILYFGVTCYSFLIS